VHPKFSPPPSFGDAFELRINLRHVEPAVWRSLRVPAEVPLSVLHEIVQMAFGWKNCHLHDFRVGEIRFGMVEGEDEALLVDERAAPLGAVARPGDTLLYTYDFGDGWKHDIAVEAMNSGGEQAVQCIAGACACPPEDCGGPPGYARMLEILANPQDEEHVEMKRWAPRNFDPERFDVAAVNKKLSPLSKRLARYQRLPR
jgi:hypothetical protein